MKNIVLTGGGTAGHIIPNLALLDELKKHFDNIYYIGSENELDKKLVESYNIPFYETKTVKFRRDKIFENLKIPFILKKGIQQAKQILIKLKPNIIFSKGGYVSLPTIYAANSLNIPIITHESDISIGLANKLAIKKANAYITSFDTTPLGNKGLYIGQPIREKIFNGNKYKILKEHDIAGKEKILFIGGSQGAKSINDFILNNIDKLDNYNIIHITGKNKATNIKRHNYIQLEFANNIEDYLECADYIVSRCGAGSAFELMALSKRVIFIPLQSKSTRGDQFDNAMYFSKFLGVDVLLEKNLNYANFNNSLIKLKNSPPSNFDYSRKTNEKIVQNILKFCIL